MAPGSSGAHAARRQPRGAPSRLRHGVGFSCSCYRSMSPAEGIDKDEGGPGHDRTVEIPSLRRPERTGAAAGPVGTRRTHAHAQPAARLQRPVGRPAGCAQERAGERREGQRGARRRHPRRRPRLLRRPRSQGNARAAGPGLLHRPVRPLQRHDADRHDDAPAGHRPGPGHRDRGGLPARRRLRSRRSPPKRRSSRPTGSTTACSARRRRSRCPGPWRASTPSRCCSPASSSRPPGPPRSA